MDCRSLYFIIFINIIYIVNSRNANLVLYDDLKIRKNPNYYILLNPIYYSMKYNINQHHIKVMI